MECTCLQQQVHQHEQRYTCIVHHRKTLYQQTIPVILQGSLYPTLASLSSEEITPPEEAQTLCNKVSKGLEKYLQDAEQRRALEVNYFDDNTTGQNEEPNLEDVEQTIQPSKDNQILPTQTVTVDTNVARNTLESLKSDTGHTLRQHLPVHTDADEKHQKIKTSEGVEQDANDQHRDGKHSVEDTLKETTPTQSQ